MASHRRPRGPGATAHCASASISCALRGDELPVFVHCMAGVGRSPTLVLAHLLARPLPRPATRMPSSFLRARRPRSARPRQFAAAVYAARAPKAPEGPWPRSILRALRPPQASAAAIASVPYDVVDTDEARALAAGNALSFLPSPLGHRPRPLSLARHPSGAIGRPSGASTCTMYEEETPRARGPGSTRLSTLGRGRRREVVAPVYSEHGRHDQTGVVACCSTTSTTRTASVNTSGRADKEDDRTRRW